MFVHKISNKHSEEYICYRGPMIWNDLPLDIRKQTYNCLEIRVKRLVSAIDKLQATK